MTADITYANMFGAKVEQATAVRAFLHALDNGWFGDDIKRIDLSNNAFVNALRASTTNTPAPSEAIAQPSVEPVAFVITSALDMFDVNGTELVDIMLCPKGTLRPEQQTALYLSPSTEVERLTRERDEARRMLDCALIREGNEKHNAKIAHQNMNAEIRARETAEATIRSLEERLAEVEKRWMMSDAQFADMEFLSIEGFLDWQRDRRSLTNGAKT